MDKMFKSVLVILRAIMICSIGGVFAFWKYATGVVDDNTLPYQLHIEEFYYAENVPDDEEHELSHNALLMKIVDPVEGLNNPKSLLSNAVEDRFDDGYDNVSSSQQVSGGNLKKVFSTIKGFEYVGFLIVYVTDEEYYVYTYDHRDTSKIGVTVDTYLTHIHLRDGKWVLSGGFEGTAISCVYNGKTNGPYKNTINPDTYIRT